MAHPLQYRQAAQRIGLPPACARKHRSDGPEAYDALTIKPDHLMGACHSLQDWIDRLGPPVIYHSWDTAYSTKTTADYTALTKWAVFDGYAILTEAQHFRGWCQNNANKSQV